MVLIKKDELYLLQAKFIKYINWIDFVPGNFNFKNTIE